MFSLDAIWELLPSRLPSGLGAYAALMTDGLRFFVERLPPARRNEIIADQSMLPFHSGLEHRLASLLSHSPTLHKLGQVVARDRRFSLEFRHALRMLESAIPATPIRSVAEGIEHRLGSLQSHRIKLDDAPLAEGSVAIVVPFTWRDPSRNVETHGVFKLLKPGVETRLLEDFQVWPDLGDFLADRSVALGLPDWNARSLFDEIRSLLSNEVRLDQEREHIRAAADLFDSQTNIVVPRLLPFEDGDLTAMERAEGSLPDQALAGADELRRETAVSLIRALLLTPLYSTRPVSLFHADPHAGNIMVNVQHRSKPQITLLDWSLVGRLSKSERELLVRLFLEVVIGNTRGIARCVMQLARNELDHDSLMCTIHRLLDGWPAMNRPIVDNVAELLDKAVMKYNARFSDGLFLFRKVLLTLEGVIRDIDANCVVEHVIWPDAIRRFCTEWPERTISGPFSRDFSTHLSNLDLLSLFQFLAWRPVSFFGEAVFRQHAAERP
jgi:ubiquinone biosynthesis protein